MSSLHKKNENINASKDSIVVDGSSTPGQKLHQSQAGPDSISLTTVPELSSDHDPSSNQEKSPRDLQEPPNGGLQAWLTVLASFFIVVNTW